MQVQTLNKGFNYISCKLIFNCETGIQTSSKCCINKDVMFLVCLIKTSFFDSLNSIEVLFIRFTQENNESVAKNNNKITSVRLRSNCLNLNKKYTIDDDNDDDWRKIQESPCFHSNKGDLDLTIEIESSFEKPWSFAPLYEDTALTDFELHGDDGSVQIHSAALAAFSPTLRRMLEGNWKETQQRALKIPQMSKATLQHLKDYIYLGVLPETGLESLLLLASCYMMDDLKEKCVTKLIKTIKADNAIALLKFALDNNFTKMYVNILEYFERGLIKVLDLVLALD